MGHGLTRGRDEASGRGIQPRGHVSYDVVVFGRGEKRVDRSIVRCGGRGWWCQGYDVTEGQHCSAGQNVRGNTAGTHPFCAVVEAFVVQKKAS